MVRATIGPTTAELSGRTEKCRSTRTCPTTASPAPPELYDLQADPGETRNVAASHPDLVRALAARYDAWFADVSTEWRRANQTIREHDLQYWKTRSPPDPRTLVPEFLRPPAGKAKQTGPIDVLRQVPGYWQYPAYADRW